MNHIWRVRKISSDEYHVLEYQNGFDTETPFVIARCTGPVPANDIMIALHVQQQLANNRHMLEGLAKADFTKSASELTAVLKKWHTVDYPVSVIK